MFHGVNLDIAIREEGGVDNGAEDDECDEQHDARHAERRPEPLLPGDPTEAMSGTVLDDLLLLFGVLEGESKGPGGG